MDYYKLKINGANKLWKKYINFAEKFIYNNKELKTAELQKYIFEKNYNVLNNISIQALDSRGDAVFEQKQYTKKVLYNFNCIRRLLLIKDDIFNEALFTDIEEIETYPVKIDGAFENNYKLLSFKNIIDCVDWTKSTKRNYVECFSA
jgi:hypothetical protein